jgi:hypothetical protein
MISAWKELGLISKIAIIVFIIMMTAEAVTTTTNITNSNTMQNTAKATVSSWAKQHDAQTVSFARNDKTERYDVKLISRDREKHYELAIFCPEINSCVIVRAVNVVEVEVP